MSNKENNKDNSISRRILHFVINNRNIIIYSAVGGVVLYGITKLINNRIDLIQSHFNNNFNLLESYINDRIDLLESSFNNKFNLLESSFSDKINSLNIPEINDKVNNSISSNDNLRWWVTGILVTLPLYLLRR